MRNRAPGAALSRRRFLAVSATLAAAGLLQPGIARADAHAGKAYFEWRGTALGAEASLRVAAERESHAAALIDTCLAEVRRLEGIFSLFDPASAVSRLNRTGRLDAPPQELLLVLDRCADIHRVSNRAFDPTVQPLWSLYASHFSRPRARPDGPGAADINAARQLVGFHNVRVSAREVSYRRTGMALTLNGIAQGFITDRIAQLLSAAGARDILVNMGEIAGRGTRPGGGGWRIGMTDPNRPGRTWRTVDLMNRALASSGGYGSQFDLNGRHHHLLEPQTGRSAQRVKGVTVAARDAVTADALATALAVMPPENAKTAVTAAGGVTAWLTLADGSRLILKS